MAFCALARRQAMTTVTKHKNLIIIQMRCGKREREGEGDGGDKKKFPGRLSNSGSGKSNKGSNE